MHPALLNALRNGATLVTANARLARELRRDFDQECRASGQVFWEWPAILPGPSWVEQCWNDCVHAAPVPEPVLLTPAQELLVWERIVEDSPQGRGLLNTAATAEAAAAAYDLAHAWDLPLAGDDLDTEDAAAFLAWARRFDEEQSRAGWLAPARLPREVAHRIEGGRIAPPARLLYAGFDELTPAWGRLLDALRAAGCVVEEAPGVAAPAAAHRTELRDASREIGAAAEWARTRLERSPAARIGVVVPDLTASRAAVERIFDDVLHPSLEMTRRTRGRAFHVSAGPSLTDVPVIATVLGVLGLRREKLPLAEAGLLIRSPFLAGARDERGSRALLDAELRRRGLAQPSVAVITRLAGARHADGSPRAYYSPQLARRLRAWRRAAARIPLRLPASGWSRLFARLARLAGWPGDRPPDSAEYQAIERWNELLGEFAALDQVAPPMDYATALARLRRMAASARFAPADEGAPIQVMGMLEAAGARFDHLWVTGLEDRAWPAPPRPNPFLPSRLQRARGVPHSSGERELAYARRLTARLLASAPEVVVSCALHEGDTDLRPSPLILHLPEIAPPDERPRIAHALRASSPALEECPDAAGPPLAPGALQRGGMGVFEKQAACPFRAFAEYRLGARALEEPVLGLTPQERGKVLHAALEYIWRELRTHAALVALAPEARTGVVARAIAAALAEQMRGRGIEAMPHVQALEACRLERLLAAWLDVEALRSPFEVAASERQRAITLGGLAVDIQVDRLDRLPDGGFAIIDYKTGAVSPAHWEGERPDAPQLPLYAATLAEPISAVLFAHVAAGDLRFRGLQEGAGVPQATEYSRSKVGKATGGTLADHIAEWRRVLENLGRQFASGAAAVSPKTPQSCLHCELPALCRVGELAAEVDDTPEPRHE